MAFLTCSLYLSIFNNLLRTTKKGNIELLGLYSTNDSGHLFVCFAKSFFSLSVSFILQSGHCIMGLLPVAVDNFLSLNACLPSHIFK